MDFDQRDEDKTSANILILGNSGQGKSYLMKLLILNLLESGKSVISLDAEHEQQEMCEAVGGCFADLMAGQYTMPSGKVTVAGRFKVEQPAGKHPFTDIPSGAY